MKVYLGQTRGQGWIEKLEAHGFGEMTVRGEMPPRRRPWAFDNGAFRDWTAGRGFDAEAFLRDLEAIWRFNGNPDFIVAPDMVAGGAESLAFSLHWARRPEVARHKVPLYLAVQDGMYPSQVFDTPEAHPWAGIFVGGTLGWKLNNASTWVQTAHVKGIPCHIGRVGTEKRVKWARRIGADSIDSCLPLFSQENFRSFLEDCVRGSMSSNSEGQPEAQA